MIRKNKTILTVFALLLSAVMLTGCFNIWGTVPKNNDEDGGNNGNNGPSPVTSVSYVSEYSYGIELYEAIFNVNSNDTYELIMVESDHFSSTSTTFEGKLEKVEGYDYYYATIESADTVFKIHDFYEKKLDSNMFLGEEVFKVYINDKTLMISSTPRVFYKVGIIPTEDYKIGNFTDAIVTTGLWEYDFYIPLNQTEDFIYNNLMYAEFYTKSLPFVMIPDSQSEEIGFAGYVSTSEIDSISGIPADSEGRYATAGVYDLVLVVGDKEIKLKTLVEELEEQVRYEVYMEEFLPLNATMEDLLYWGAEVYNSVEQEYYPITEQMIVGGFDTSATGTITVEIAIDDIVLQHEIVIFDPSTVTVKELSWSHYENPITISSGYLLAIEKDTPVEELFNLELSFLLSNNAIETVYFNNENLTYTLNTSEEGFTLLSGEYKGVEFEVPVLIYDQQNPVLTSLHTNQWSYNMIIVEDGEFDLSAITIYKQYITHSDAFDLTESMLVDFDAENIRMITKMEELLMLTLGFPTDKQYFAEIEEEFLGITFVVKVPVIFIDSELLNSDMQW